MRKTFTILSLFFTLGTSAKNIYISSAGNDIANTGLTSGSPWQTISKLNANMGLILAGDSILFRRGDTFYGGIVMTKNGTPAQPIVFSSYGTGAKPIITGLSTITGWVDLGGNIWEAPTTGVKVSNNLVLRNSVIQQVGRFPNTNAANSGYLTYTAATPTSITGPALSTTTNWSGAEVAVRLVRWEIRRRPVTSHVGGQVNFLSMVDVPKINSGYFFQRDPRTLDRDGEWYQNGSTSKLRMYFANNNPSAYTIQAATVDTLLSNNKSYVTVVNLAFTGAGRGAVINTGGQNIIMKNLDATNMGGEGFVSWFSINVLVDSCTTDNCLGGGIRVFGASSGTVNLTVKNSLMHNNCLIAGMEVNELPSGGSGLNVRGGSGVQALHNVIRNSAYNAITWAGDNVLVKNNLVDSFCSVRDDGGAIYTYTKAGSTIIRGVNRVIEDNILLHGIGARDGAPTSDLSPNGLLARYSANFIYNDEGTWDVIMRGNTCAYGPFQGFQGNGNGYLTITGNTVFGIPISHSFQRIGPPNTENPIANFVIKNNIFYPYRWRARDQAINLPTLISPDAVAINYGVIDSNYYSLRAGADTSLDIQTQKTTSPTGFVQSYRAFSYITATLGLESASINVANNGSLYYNASDTPAIVNFSGLSKKDVYGNVYNNAATIPRWGSIILIPNGAAPTSNAPPVANAGANQAITLPISSTELGACGSSDADGSMVTFGWVKISGPSGGALSTPALWSTDVSGLVTGVYKYQLTITDNLGATGKDTVQITVSAAVNTAPFASAGSDQPITLPVNFATLTGMGSDAEGAVTYHWIKVSGPAGGTIASPNASSTVVNSLQQGTYQYQLTVTDAGGLTATGLVNVIVSPAIPPANVAPVSHAGIDIVIDLPVNTTTLAGFGTDADGTIASVLWTKTSGPATGTIVTPTSGSSVFNNLVAGVYILNLRVTDNSGDTATDALQVTVNAAPVNIPPQVSAGGDQEITSPADSVLITANATDADGTVDSYSWIKISGPATYTIVDADSAETVINNLVEGVYLFEITATDNDGATDKDTVMVTVNAAAPNEDPFANGGPDKTLFLPTDFVTLVGSGTDNDGSIVSYEWREGATVLGTSASIDLTGLSLGVHTFTLTVTDDDGGVGVDTVTVEVKPTPAVMPSSYIILMDAKYIN